MIPPASSFVLLATTDLSLGGASKLPIWVIISDGSFPCISLNGSRLEGILWGFYER